MIKQLKVCTLQWFWGISYHRNIKTQGITTEDTSLIKLDVSIDFVNHLKPRRVEFFKCILKTVCWDSAFNKKSENINSNDFRMIFASSTNVYEWWSYVII